MQVRLKIDGREIEASSEATLWETARAAGIDIPVLCHSPRLRPVGVCRLCAVEVEGSRVLAAACVRRVEAGMVVRTDTERAVAARRTLVELLLSDHPTPCDKQRLEKACDLENLASRLGVAPPRWAASVLNRPRDQSSPVIRVDHQACILCDRCVRACDEVQVNQVIGRTGKGFRARIGFDLDSPMGKSTCVSCGECVASCPTGALTDRPLSVLLAPERARTVPSVCPYCGVGCGVDFTVQDGTLVKVSGREENPGNQGRLCVKGRYGFDYALHRERLRVPLIRRPEFYPKGALSDDVAGRSADRRPGERAPDLSRAYAAFREASWDEALDRVANRLLEIKRQHGPSALAGFGSAKCSNEEAYLFQKLVRSVFGTNNVDHCTRLCHASSVAALVETIGSGAVSNPFGDVLLADACLVTGSNTTDNHPVAATFIKQAVARGTTLIVVDPRRPDLADHARVYLRPNPGTDVALYNAMMNVIIGAGLHDERFIRERTENFELLRQTVAAYTPEIASRITGVEPALICEAALAYGAAERAITFWGMGISQHTTGTDNARCLISLALLTGNLGRPGTGLHPLRGQNNVQGASDSGLIPMFYPDYQAVSDPEARRKFEAAWGAPLDPRPGLTVTEIVAAALEGWIRGMIMFGENPFLSDPNINKVRRCLAALEFLAVQDIFLTETAEFADVILPAAAFPEKEGTYTNTDRRVQLGRRAIDPPGQARSDREVLVDLARRMGAEWCYDSPESVFRELCSLAPSLAGLSYEKLGTRGAVWPLRSPQDAEQPVLFVHDFPRGRGKFVPCEFAPAKELPDADFPLILNTGRLLEHWHTGTMTRRSKALDAIAPAGFVEVHPADASRLGIGDGDWVRVSSRRGEVRLAARLTERTPAGSVFIPFHFREAAANLLTIDALDPFGKIPEFKLCAVRLEPLRPVRTPQS